MACLITPCSALSVAALVPKLIFIFLLQGFRTSFPRHPTRCQLAIDLHALRQHYEQGAQHDDAEEDHAADRPFFAECQGQDQQHGVPVDSEDAHINAAQDPLQARIPAQRRLQCAACSSARLPDIANRRTRCCGRGAVSKLGILLQNISGEFSSGRKSFVNTVGHAEYRNKTRNLQWDIEANGKLYFTGLNKGDYQAHISLERLLGNKIGSLQLGFENTSRTPSFIFDSRSSFYLLKKITSFKKENNTHLFASYFLPSFRFRLTGHYYLATNYTYFRKYYQLQQESTLFNVLQIAVEKSFKIGKRRNWHTEIYFQQAVGNAPIQVPVIFTRNRFAYEGNLGFKNLTIALGAELRYATAYMADGYSPVQAQFYYQDSITISNPLPDITAYMHFRIRSFKAFVRVENLNTGRKLEGFGFTNNNLVAPGYAMPGLQFRLGVYWSFVN